MRVSLSITSKSVSAQRLDELVSSVAPNALAKESDTRLRGLSIVKSKPLTEASWNAAANHWFDIVAPEIAHRSKITSSLGLPDLPFKSEQTEFVLPPVPKMVRLSQEAKPLELPPLPSFVSSETRPILTSAAEIIDRVSTGETTVAVVAPEFLKQPSLEFIAKIPEDMRPLAAALRDSLSVFPDEELEEIMSGWDWKSRRLAQKLTK